MTNKNDLMSVILKHIEKAAKENKNSLILTPKAHALDAIEKHGNDVTADLVKMGFNAELSKDGNLDDCIRIKF